MQELIDFLRSQREEGEVSISIYAKEYDDDMPEGIILVISDNWIVNQQLNRIYNDY